MATKLALAEIVATTAHIAIGQKRKYTGECYTTHLAEVVEILKTVNADEETLAIGWLHDVVEDTGIELEYITRIFGEDISTGVHYCTEISKKEDGNRATRKAIDATHFANGNAKSQTVKVADIISNVRSIVVHDSEFAKVYVYEKQRQLSLLTKADARLVKMANDLVGISIRRIEDAV